jgi:acetyl esterase
MKKTLKVLKYLSLSLLVLALILVGYIYSLTFTPYGRMDWRQAAFAKLVSFDTTTEEQLKNMTLEEYRNAVPPMPLESVGSIDTLHIMPDNLPLFVYKPVGLSPNAPIVIYYHGGGFFVPFNNLSNSYARQYANRFKAVIVAVDYRTAPQFPFPTHVNDSYNTFKWVVENASKIGGNPNKIAVIGESAGGNIATVVCQKAQKEGFNQIKYQVLFCPSTDMGHPLSYPSTKKFENGYLLGKAQMSFVGKYVAKIAENGLNPELSPMLAQSLAGLPHAFVITTEFDPLHDEGLAYSERLAKEGVPTKYKDLKGCIHVMAGPFMEDKFNELNAEIALELDKAFR